jgi:hypothetical protein
MSCMALQEVVACLVDTGKQDLFSQRTSEAITVNQAAAPSKMARLEEGNERLGPRTEIAPLGVFAAQARDFHLTLSAQRHSLWQPQISDSVKIDLIPMTMKLSATGQTMMRSSSIP